jgi:hypothetical protein
MNDPELIAFLTGQLEYWQTRAKQFETLYRTLAALDQRAAQESIERDRAKAYSGS